MTISWWVAVLAVLGVSHTVRGVGDRFAWSPVELELEDLVELEEELEENVRNVRKVEQLEEQVEGRFVGKEVLCKLGLADCSSKITDAGVHYVQPVQVVPYGNPVAAVAADGQYTPTLNQFTDTERQSLNTGYGAPSYETEYYSYDAPSSAYGAPSYEAPDSAYGAPKPSYEAPKPSYGAPKPSYGAPKPSYEAPNPSYGVPKHSYEAPKPSYGAPKPSYEASKPDVAPVYIPQSAPTPVYAPPPAKYATPDGDFGKYQEEYGAPEAPILGPYTPHGVRDQRETDVETEISSQTEVVRPTREGRLDECYCVPAAECPAANVVGNVFKDYSALINPRVKNPNLEIVAPGSDSRVEVVSIVLPSQSRSLLEEELDDKNEEDEEVIEEEENLSEETEEISRKKRNELSTDQDQPEGRISRLSNVFVPEEEEVDEIEDIEEDEDDYTYDEDYEEDDLFLSRDGSEIELKELTKEEKMKRRAERRAERQAKRRAALAEKKKETKKKAGDKEDIKKTETTSRKKTTFIESNADLIDTPGGDRSFDSLSEFSSDVSTKVGDGITNATTGVKRIIGNVANLFTDSTSSGQLKPTFGVSFGLPQRGGYGYGGYQQNPLGTGSAVNPYYTSPDGVEVGPVSLNPLFSLQAGTTDTGDLALKPLVNLHLTPNGCGVLGCDKAAYDYVDSTLKSIPNPIDVVKGLFKGEDDHHKHGIYEDYTAPQSSYGSPSAGYGPPSNSYGVPSSGYGPPTTGYETPNSGYGVPNSGYETTNSGYGAPNSGYETPNSGYGPPSTGYEVPNSGYGAPDAGHGHGHGHGHGFGSQNTVYGIRNTGHQAGHPAYNAPSYNSPQTGSSYETETSQMVGPVNIHHHFHHKGQNQYSSYELDSFREYNQVKRNTESGGFLPPEDGLSLPQESGGAFRFPRKDIYRKSIRGGRKLELSEEEQQKTGEVGGAFRFSKEKAGRRLDLKAIGSDEETEKVTNAEESEKESSVDSGEKVQVIYSEEVAPQKDLKFVDRRRRSPDHGGHGGHGGHGAEPFGPNGIRPPRCGGENSGYVCCSVPGSTHSSHSSHTSQSSHSSSVSSSHISITSPSSVSSSSSSSSFDSSPSLDFNEIISASNIRGTRQQPQQFNGIVGNQFSTFGQCGRRNAQGVTGRINNPANTFNDGDTEFAEYPWQAAILKKEQYDNVYVCGGSLIDATHILTAAHCIRQYRPEEIRIRLGEWDVNNDSEFYPNIEFDVLSISIHPEFYSGNLYNDIAVIKLDGYVDFERNPHISPVCLPDSLAEFAGKRCYVSGWGKDAFGGAGDYQHTLKEVDLPVLSHADCEQKLKNTRLGYDFILHPGFVCAGGEEGKDACKGDGGGPLVCQVSGSWQLAGLVSWGVGCGQRDVPGVYVKVGHYNQWIQEMMLTT